MSTPPASRPGRSTGCPSVAVATAANPRFADSKKELPLLIRKAFAVLATAALAAVATGCAEFDDVSLSQPAGRTVELSVTACAGATDACTTQSPFGSYTLGLTLNLPDGVTAPASLGTTGSP